MMHLCIYMFSLYTYSLLDLAQQPSSKRLGQGILEIGQRLDRLGAGSNQPNVLFFFHLWVREFFVLHRMVGRTWRGVLTPGYFEPSNFPSIDGR